MPPTVIDARGLSKRFVLRHNRAASLKVRVLGLLHERQREVLEEFWAIKDVSLAIRQGESVGLIGRNGSGKSTFLKLVAGIHTPTRGRLLVAGSARIGTMIELGVGFHPDLNGTENVFLNAAINGLSRAEIEAIYPAIVEYSGLEHFMDVPLKNYSSGMHMRLGFAIAANLDPDILLLDEIFAVGDEDFQKQCMQTMERFAAEGRTLVFVSHAPAAVRAMCRRVCVLDHGRLLFDGGVDDGLAEYQRLIARAIVGSPAAPERAAPEPVRRPAESSAASSYGAWRLDFLAAQGLQRHHRLLEVSCGGTRSDELAGYVGAERFQHWDISTANTEPLHPFDYAIAAPLLSNISLNAMARCVAIAMMAMAPRARFFATWRDDADPLVVPDTVPFRYPFAILAGIGDALGCDVQRVGDAAAPDGECVLLLTRRP